MLLCLNREQQLCEAYQEQLIKLQNSFVSKCYQERLKDQRLKGVDQNDYNNDKYTISNSDNSEFAGYVKLAFIGKVKSASYFYLVVSGYQKYAKIYINHHMDTLIDQANLLDLNWVCEDSNYPCSVEKYIEQKNKNNQDPYLEKVIKEVIQAF